MAKQQQTTQPLTPSERLERGIEMANELAARINSAILEKQPVKDLRDEHAAAELQIRQARADIEAAEAEAKAEREREALREIEPEIQAAIRETLAPLELRSAQGFEIATPPLPKPQLSYFVNALTARRAADAETAKVQAAVERRNAINERLAALANDRQALIQRRTEGDLRQSDAADLALIDADSEALTQLVSGAQHDAEVLYARAVRSEANAKTFEGALSDEQRRVRAAFFESVAREAEKVLRECYQEQNSNRAGWGHAPMVWDPEVRKALGMAPLK